MAKKAKTKTTTAEPKAPKRKGFPVLDTDKKCFPEGVCICCLQGFDVIEPVGWVKQKGSPGKKYFHARCMDPTIGGKKK